MPLTTSIQKWGTLSNRELAELTAKLGYEFNDPGLLLLALTHRSYCAEHPETSSNERLEFLGDSVLGLSVTSNIYNTYPDLPEGQLAKLRASVVNTEALSELGTRLEIGSFLRLGKGEDQSGGRSKESILADVVEAIIGAIYVDGGWSLAEKIVLNLTRTTIIEAADDPGKRDYKTQLQELAAKLNLGAPCLCVRG